MQSIGSRLHLFLLYLSALYTPPSISVNISMIISIYRFANKFRHDETEEYPGITYESPYLLLFKLNIIRNAIAITAKKRTGLNGVPTVSLKR